MIEFKDIMIGIEAVLNDVKIDPYDVVLKILLLYFDERITVSVKDLRGFFDQYEGYFSKEDVREFLLEAMTIQREGAMIDLQEIASLIRDDIECFAK